MLEGLSRSLRTEGYTNRKGGITVGGDRGPVAWHREGGEGGERKQAEFLPWERRRSGID